MFQTYVSNNRLRETTVMTRPAPGTKQRILDAAVRLFARRGYTAVGVREIAITAKANIAAVNYHYGNKSGLLKAILERFAELYWQKAVPPSAGTGMPGRHVLATVKSLIALYREYIELALAADGAVAVRIPDVNTFQARLLARHRVSDNEWFARLGIDVADPASAAVVRGMLTTLIEVHFRRRYENEVVTGPREGLSRAERASLPELSVHYDDAFYDRYARQLTKFYLGGARALRARP